MVPQNKSGGEFGVSFNGFDIGWVIPEMTATHQQPSLTHELSPARAGRIYFAKCTVLVYNSQSVAPIVVSN